MADKQITLIKDRSGIQFFEVIFSYDPRLVDFVKKIPTRKFNASSKTWRIRADHLTARYIESFARMLDFHLDWPSSDFIEKMLLPVTHETDIAPLKRELRNFQKIGTAYAMKYQRCFIADEMGLGKSGESIAAVETLDAYPCLIICPASLKLNWKKEIAMWVDRDVNVIDGLVKAEYEIINDKKIVSGYVKPNYHGDFVVINYDILNRDKKPKSAENPKGIVIPDHKDLLKNIPFKSVIIDESHMASNYKSLRTKAVKEISRKIPYRFALSGTPILNRPKELIAQLDILDRLDSMGGFWTFAKRYCAAVEGNFGWDFSGASNLDELHARLKSTCFIRRKKEDVLDELPPKERIMLPVDIDRAEYNEASKNFKKWLSLKMANDSDYMEELKKIKQLTHSQRQIMANARFNHKLNKTLQAEAIVKIEKLKQIVARAKLVKAYDFIDNFLNYDDKLIIFTKHEEIYKKLIKKYDDISVHIVGGMTSKQKDNAVEEFQNNPKIRLFIGAMDAAGVGLTLTASSTVAFIELGWTSAVHDQAEDRAHRIGQKDFVKCYYFYAENTIEEKILELIEKKRAMSANILDGQTITPDDASDDDISEILAKFI